MSTSASGNTYYGTMAAALLYVADSVTPAAAAFAVATLARREAALVSAARLLDRQIWQDAVNTFALRDAIPAFGQAGYELGVLLLAKPGLFDAVTADVNVQSVTAGPVGVTFFKPTQVGRLPKAVIELVGSYLSSAAAAIGGGSERLGDCAESQFDDCDRYGLTRGV